jgi:hypothetical protein
VKVVLRVLVKKFHNRPARHRLVVDCASRAYEHYQKQQNAKHISKKGFQIV